MYILKIKLDLDHHICINHYVFTTKGVFVDSSNMPTQIAFMVEDPATVVTDLCWQLAALYTLVEIQRSSGLVDTVA